MNAYLTNKLRDLHQSESGAIMILLLAAFLILFMCAMTLYDAGQASQDKMKVQIAADSSAYSHSVVKARSMNMMVYANVIKRMYYSYMATYANAWTAIFLAMAASAADCFKFLPNWSACASYFVGLFTVVIPETLEALVTNIPTLTGLYGAGYVPKEIDGLERYQQYMHNITPWWAYVEGLGRGMTNGAMISGTWPVPPSILATIRNSINSAAWVLDKVGINVWDRLPPTTNNVDSLPIARRDRQRLWQTRNDPFAFHFTQGSLLAGVGYCSQYAASLEAVIHGVQTYTQSSKQPRNPLDWRKTFALMQLIPAVGCIFAHLFYHNGAESSYLDWHLNNGVRRDKNDWAQATSNVSLAYRPRGGRNEDDGERRKFGILGRDHDRNELYTNEGYFAFSRGEIVYKQPLRVLSFISLPAFFSTRLGIQDEPDMWSPRWKGRRRPFAVDGELLGSSVKGSPAGMDMVLNDMIPYMAVASLLGIFDPKFNFSTGGKDLMYLYRVGQSWDAQKLDAVPK